MSDSLEELPEELPLKKTFFVRAEVEEVEVEEVEEVEVVEKVEEVEVVEDEEEATDAWLSRFSLDPTEPLELLLCMRSPCDRPPGPPDLASSTTSVPNCST